MEMILLNFEGYWLERYMEEVPHDAGVYCVYACEPMAADKIVVLRELIYVGSADDVAACLMGHAQKAEWKMRLREGETLCYSFAPADGELAGVAQRALVNHHTPPCNRIAQESVPILDAQISIAGDHIFLDDSVMVRAS